MDGYLGSISMFGGDYEPAGWMFCDGRLLDISQYPPLYSILGNRYGGDGVRTFALPDLREVNASGQKVNGYMVGKPSSIICYQGSYPARA